MSTLPDKMTVVDRNGKPTIMEVTYEWRPNRCAFCNTFQHGSTNCTFAKKEEERLLKSQDNKTEEANVNGRAEKAVQKSGGPDASEKEGNNVVVVKKIRVIKLRRKPILIRRRIAPRSQSTSVNESSGETTPDPQ